VKKDVNILIRALRENLPPLLEQTWSLMVKAYPNYSHEVYAENLKRFTADMVERTRELHIPEEERIEFDIVMGRAHRQVVEEFLAGKAINVR